MDISGLFRGSQSGTSEPVRKIVHFSFVDRVSLNTVALVIGHGTKRTVYRNFLEIWSAQTENLGVEVRKEAALEERVVAGFDAGYQVAGTKSDLFCFCEKIVRITVKYEFSDTTERDEFFRDDFGRVEEVEFEVIGIGRFDDLEVEFVFGVSTRLDSFP